MDPYYFLDIELEENEDDISPDGNWIINPDNDYKILYKDKNIHVYFIIRTRSSTYSTQYGHLGLFRIGGYFLFSIPLGLLGVHPLCLSHYMLMGMNYSYIRTFHREVVFSFH